MKMEKIMKRLSKPCAGARFDDSDFWQRYELGLFLDDAEVWQEPESGPGQTLTILTFLNKLSTVKVSLDWNCRFETFPSKSTWCTRDMRHVGTGDRNI